MFRVWAFAISFGMMNLYPLVWANFLCAQDAQEVPDSEEVAAAGRETISRLEKDPATWKAVIELPDGNEALVTTTQTPNMRHLVISFKQLGKFKKFVRIIERDGFWYVESNQGRFKYLPYEAQLPIPAIYVFLARSNLLAIVDSKAFLGRFDKTVGEVAVYFTDLPKRHRQQLERSLKTLNQLEEKKSGASDARTRQAISLLKEILDEGIEVRVNVRSGIVEQSGARGTRLFVRNFEWLKTVDPDLFDIEKHTWDDQTASLVSGKHSTDDLIMISNQPLWEPGQPAGDTDVLMMNIKSGLTRRLPYAFGLVSSGCYSRDRKFAYVAGQVPKEGSISIFELDLSTGEHRQLGGAELQFGNTLSPALSPDGKQLVVQHLDNEAGPLHSQVYTIDIKSGESRAVGKPLDAACISWLPNGEGFVLVSREHKSWDEPATNTICKMKLNGDVTPICKGRSPTVLLPHSRILFRDQDTREWHTCDLDGQNQRKVGNGLKGYGFPTPSSNGDSAIMMKFDGPKGPQPHIVELATGNTKRLNVGPGLWGYPSWR